MGFVTGYPLFRLPIISMVLCAQEESMLVCFGNLGEPESSLTGIAGYNNQGDINNRYLMHQNLQQTQTGLSGLRYKKKPCLHPARLLSAFVPYWISIILFSLVSSFLGFFGTSIISTPSLTAALILSFSASSGRIMDCWNFE